ncbi:DUF742 domain-containing protein [Streptomyces niveiscabiei]|uniref:DUF742 domain-containing protein n=1 Tax=Streptomyces niveiscabiei TaxID=164115 RepID=UPI0029B43C66|nr:DUF742 domain-containing protein [Streptomyces niveiscabiei]MDX3381558.1 DUF742 domain-containing protein [Streptomyces niveiscabiei]
MTPPQRRRRAALRPLPKPAEPAAGGNGEGKEKKAPERLYTISDADGERAPLDLVTLVVARTEPNSSTGPERTVVLRMCATPLSLAEVSAYLSLPFSVVSVLITDMLAAGLLDSRAPVVRQKIPDRSLLEAVMHGLQRL